MTRTCTYRDAGLHSSPLRLLNRASDLVGSSWPRLEVAAVLDEAVKKAGVDDFGPDTVREPLEVICESANREAKLTAFGRMVFRQLLTSALVERLKVIDWVKQHPEVEAQRVERPWIILGLPRTGTTLLSFLLGLDPVARPLVQWEASHPVPPPDLATHLEDPRIAEVARQFSQLEKLNPAVQAMHPFGATLATECVTLFAFDLRSLSFETQGLVTSYGQWLEKTDMRSTYAMHELSLKLLQSRMPTESWVLKTPHHLWCLEEVRDFYPDARLIWTHRDPAKVVPSVASLNTSLQKTNSDAVDPVAVGHEWDDKLHLAVERGRAFDQTQQGIWCSHLLYHDLVADPIAAVKRIYREHGAEVLPLHERRMETWMQMRGQDAFGRHGYRAEDFGLSLAGIRERYADYIDAYGIPPEA